MIAGGTFELRIRAVDGEGTLRMGTYASVEMVPGTMAMKLGAFSTDPRWPLKDHFPNLQGKFVNLTTLHDASPVQQYCVGQAGAPIWYRLPGHSL